MDLETIFQLKNHFPSIAESLRNRSQIHWQFHLRVKQTCLPVTLLLITFLEFLSWIFVLWSHLGRFCVGSMSVHDLACLFNSGRFVTGGFGREIVFTIILVIIAWWALESRCWPNSILFPFKFFSGGWSNQNSNAVTRNKINLQAFYKS